MQTETVSTVPTLSDAASACSELIDVLDQQDPWGDEIDRHLDIISQFAHSGRGIKHLAASSIVSAVSSAVYHNEFVVFSDHARRLLEAFARINRR